jgi:hypothetical protein
MTAPPNQPRLLPDYAAAPTRAERAATRKWWRAGQGSLLADDETAGAYCAACASTDHQTDACPSGKALTLTGE